MQILPLVRAGQGDGLLSHLEDCLVKLLMTNKGTRGWGDSRCDDVGERRKTKKKVDGEEELEKGQSASVTSVPRLMSRDKQSRE